jgi:predicted Fe-Mo cluster-binding NifX family protein
MNICFPVVANKGLSSELYGHFASAPIFLVVETVSGRSSAIVNCDPENPFGGCNPFVALRRQSLDAIIVDGIGDDALRSMQFCGFKVYQAHAPVVSDNLRLFDRNILRERELLQSHLEGRCSSGESGCNCSHHHTNGGLAP